VDEKELVTANYGRVQFRKRRVKSNLQKGLSEIRQFLDTIDTPVVTKVVA
jgi:hypothetical protein